MVEMNRKWVFIGLVVFGLGAGILLLTRDKPTGNYDEFAQCLSGKGASMYGAYWCSHCENQKKMFGGSFKYVNYVECTENEDLCNEKGIQGYPTWIIDNQQYPGEQTFE